jgi:lysozyme
MSRTLRFGTIALVAALTAGCGAGESEPLGTAEGEVVVCAKGTTVEGIDVSVYQGNIDWAAVKASGRDFAIARISDNLYQDTKFAQNWPAIKAAGMIRGAYQFFRPGGDPNAQADLVIQKVGALGPGDLPVTCDVEVADGVSAATYAANLKIWVDKVTAGTGKAPMIYTGKYFWNASVVSSAFSDLPLWIAAWGPPCPDLPNPWSDWAFWQYSATGSVPGISGDVDLDKFNGTLQDLQALANGGPDWGAKFVDQSWPFATMTTQMTVNQSLPATIELRNVGKQTWDGNTRLGTTVPRDRMSAFVAPDWLAPNRASQVSGTVAPGDTYKFQFTWKAPDTPGTYDEFFSVVQEGVAWFGDPGQGGPADNAIEAKIEVVEAAYHGVLLDQSFPAATEDAIEMTPGQTLDGWIDLKNVGTATWKAGETKLAPTPRDMPSPLHAQGWLSDTRVSTLDADVAPGETGHFALSIAANEVGDFTQTFSLVEEGVTWFGDAPMGGGPLDGQIAMHVIVAKNLSGTGGTGGTGTGGSGGLSGEAKVEAEAKGKCSCDVAGQSDGGGSAIWIAAAGAVVLLRRRRSR